jgi:hydroxyacylglutathione hydrolase
MSNPTTSTPSTPLKIHQLLAGTHFSKNASNPVEIMSSQMANFIYVIADMDKKEAVIIDGAWDVDSVFGFVENQLGCKIKCGAWTHRHLDHVGGRFQLQQQRKVVVPGVEDFVKRKIPVFIGEDDVLAVSKQTGVAVNSIHSIKDGDSFFPRIKVLHTPGHTPGSVCFYVDDKYLITGDTLFIGSCGRVDLQESNPRHMLQSLIRLASMPRQTVVLPGHNYAPKKESTIGLEIDTNFMVQDALSNVEELNDTKKKQGGGGGGDLTRNLTSASHLPDYLAAATRALEQEKWLL